MLEPVAATYEPELISDGGGLPFPPSALSAPRGQLDPDEPVVGALMAQLDRQKPAADGSTPRLEDWRLLARTESEGLFGRDMPPRLVTVTVRQDGRRGRWQPVAVTKAGSLRTTRDGVRASSWQLDTSHPPGPEDTIIRMLVTEQTRSGGALATKRLLAPDLHDGEDEVLVTMFITPKPGVQLQMASATPATPVRVRLPSPLGERQLVDGALYEPL